MDFIRRQIRQCCGGRLVALLRKIRKMRDDIIFGWLRPVSRYLPEMACQYALKAGDNAEKQRHLRRAYRWWQLLCERGGPIQRIVRLDDDLRVWVNICAGQPAPTLLFGEKYEPDEIAVVKALTAQGAVFFDVGAHVGIYTLIASRLVGADGAVHAFEPCSDSYELLSRNTTLNQASNVRLNNLAVNETGGAADLLVNRESGLSSLGQTGRGGVVQVERVDCVSLDEYADRHGISELDFLKVDVEGYEGHVLRGGRRLIERSRNLVILCELCEKNFRPLGYSVNEVIAWLREREFGVWEIDWKRHQLIKLDQSPPWHDNDNFLFVRPGTSGHRSLLQAAAKGQLTIAGDPATPDGIPGMPDGQPAPFIYVHCGARGDSKNPLVEAMSSVYYVGFEPDPEECARLMRAAGRRYYYFPVAVGKCSGTRTLYLTSNPACSSLLAPNAAFFGRFKDCASQIAITGSLEVQTVALDAYLPAVGIRQADFLELDTQGTELEILQGAEGFLTSSIIGIKVEVEFSPIYQNQPLFSDVDAYLRQFGFMLFDLSRNYYRRQNYPYDVETRGQLLWGDAFYLKDYHCLTEQGMKAAATRLAHVATFYGFHDYALEIIDSLLQGGAGPLNPAEANGLAQARIECLSSQGSGRLVKVMSWLEHSRLRWLFHKLGAISKRVSGAYTFTTRQKNYSWND